jgi:hypothetical protein
MARKYAQIGLLLPPTPLAEVIIPKKTVINRLETPLFTPENQR